MNSNPTDSIELNICIYIYIYIYILHTFTCSVKGCTTHWQQSTNRREENNTSSSRSFEKRVRKLAQVVSRFNVGTHDEWEILSCHICGWFKNAGSHVIYLEPSHKSFLLEMINSAFFFINLIFWSNKTIVLDLIIILTEEQHFFFLISKGDWPPKINLQGYWVCREIDEKLCL
jgi:hypothetical protein